MSHLHLDQGMKRLKTSYLKRKSILLSNNILTVGLITDPIYEKINERKYSISLKIHIQNISEE